MKKGILGFLLFIVSFALVCVNNGVFANELTDDYFDIASNYFSANNSEKALEYIDYILEIEPDNVMAIELKNKILPPAPIATTQEPCAQTPQNFVVLNVPQADVEKMSYDSDYYNVKGQEFYQNNDLNSAIEYFYKAIKLNSKNAQAYNNLAMSYWQKKNTDAAIKYFKKANSLNHCYTQPLVNLAKLYIQLGDENKQIYYLNKAIKENPNDYLAYYSLGDYFKNKSEYKKAIENYKETIKINDKFSQAYLALATCFFETEEFNYSILALKQYQEFNQNSDYAYYLQAKAQDALNDYTNAKVSIQKAIAINDKPEYQFELAKNEYYFENYQQALEIFQNLLNTLNSAEFLNYSGLCNYKLKNIELAIANFNKAIELDSQRPIYYYNLAQCYKSLGDKKNYTKYIGNATKIIPINYQDFIDLSYIYFDNGNTNYAINTLNSAIKKYPTIKALYLSKLKIYETIGDNQNYNATKNLINERFNQ